MYSYGCTRQNPLSTQEVEDLRSSNISNITDLHQYCIHSTKLSVESFWVIVVIIMGSRTPKGTERLGMSNGTRSGRTDINTPPAAAKTLLDYDMSEDDTDVDQSNGVSLNLQGDSAAKPVFRVNEDYARRFEHNKKREELQRRKFSKIITYPVVGLTPYCSYSGRKVWQGLCAHQT